MNKIESENINDVSSNTDNSKKELDVLSMQIIMCIILLTVIAVMNIALPDTTYSLVCRFKELTQGETEQFFKDIVFLFMEKINA